MTCLERVTERGADESHRLQDWEERLDGEIAAGLLNVMAGGVAAPDVSPLDPDIKARQTGRTYLADMEAQTILT